MLKRWRAWSITTKFGVAFGLMLAVIVLMAVISFAALTVVRRQTERTIVASAEIQHLVLQMGHGMEKARRLQRDFFSQYPIVGLDKALRTFVPQNHEQIAEVVALSGALQRLISAPEVSEALRQSKVNLEFYLSAANRYREAFDEAVALTGRLADEKSGLRRQLLMKSSLLRETLLAAEIPLLKDLFRDMLLLEKEYWSLRRRPIMQSAFNVAFRLRKAVESSSSLPPEEKEELLLLLDDYRSIAEEILSVDIALRGKFNEFDLQIEAIEPISAELVSLAEGEVEKARSNIKRTSALVTLTLAGSSTAGLALAGLIIWLLNNSITRNLVNLSRAAGALQAGSQDVSARVDSEDELGNLAKSFNSMAERIGAQMEELELKVAERTAELEKANEELRVEVEVRKKTEKALRLAAEAAEGANRAKSEFLANMSHELRTPLNAILGFAQVMERDPELTSGQRQSLDTIGRSGEHLLELINDVLDMARIEAGKITLEEQSFELAHLLTAVEKMIRIRAEEAELRFVVERAPELPRFLKTDGGKLRQILINLLGNAVKFTQRGEVNLRVKREASRLLFEVEDTGPGIAAEDRERIFAPFEQPRRGLRPLEGAGLGLPISRRYVQLMGGDIEVESEEGRGSSFRFDIPFEEAEAQEAGEKPAARRVIGLEPGQRAWRILIAEDREESRLLLVKLLEAVGFKVRSVADGAQALEEFERWRPDLVWMDMRMPVMDGYEATRRIKSTDRGEKTVVIALSASAFEGDRNEMIAAGCDDFVRKPLRETEVFQAMEKYLHLRYTYRKEERQGAVARTSEPMIREALAKLPGPLLKDLEEAVVELKAERILAVIGLIGEGDPLLGDALEELAENYRYDRILRLLQPEPDGENRI